MKLFLDTGNITDIEARFKLPLTDSGIERFLTDWANAKGATA